MAALHGSQPSQQEAELESSAISGSPLILVYECLTFTTLSNSRQRLWVTFHEKGNLGSLAIWKVPRSTAQDNDLGAGGFCGGDAEKQE